MSVYGVELISDTGHKFVIPDSNPYTFHKRYDLIIRYGTSSFMEVDTGIPASVKTMVFFRIGDDSDPLSYIARACDTFVRNGTWWIVGGSAAYSITIHAYVFTDREFFDVNGSGYGVQIFDAEGNQIIGCNSRPLKMRIEGYAPSSSSLVTDLGYPAAVTPSIVYTHKWSWGIYLDFGSVASVVGEGNGYSQMLKEIGTNENRIQYDSGNYPQYFLAINSRDYD